MRFNRSKTQRFSKRILAGLYTLSIALCVHAGSNDEFKPVFPKYNPSPNIHYKMLVENIGNVQLNQGKISAIGVAIDSPFSDDEGLYRDYQDCKLKACTIKFELNESLRSQFKIAFLPGIGSVLMPKEWIIKQADMGPSGVASAMIMSPKQDEVITIYNSSACIGCGMRPATLYFPKLIQESIKNEYGYISDPHKYINIVHPKNNVAYFSYQIPNYPNKTHGLAFYSDGDFNFQEIQVSLKPEHQTWARYILNFYQATHLDP